MVKATVVPALAGLVLLGATIPVASAATRVFSAQLDGDRALEQVRTEQRRCRQPSACSRLVIRDGRRRAVLSPLSQRPRLPYGWRVAKVRLRDLTGDGIKELVWNLSTVGGTVSSPTRMAVTSWDGRRARRLFTLENGGTPEPGYAYVVTATGTIVPTGGLPEIETREALHTTEDPNCCPSAYRVQRHRWNGSSIAPVEGTKRVEPAARAG